MAEAKAVPKEEEARFAPPPPQPFLPAQSTTYQVQSTVGYPQVPSFQQPGTYVVQQGAQMSMAGQNGMVCVAQNPAYPMAQPQIQTTTFVRQPVSVAFGAPLIHPGVQKPIVMQQMVPQMQPAPPPYPGLPADAKYDVAGAPNNLYGK